MSDWIGSRRIVDENQEFTEEVDKALREYRGPGIYKHTGEQIAPMPESDKNTGVDSSGRVIWRPQLFWIKTKEEYNSMWDLKSS
jgi:hypothetical protein|tara:strand:- start:67 stop:318 length:252 start_codon:yes stop_codon:yes gene_type:complete